MSEPVVRISIDMDRRCSVCRRKGAMANGRCLRCAVEAILKKTLVRAEGNDDGDQNI